MVAAALCPSETEGPTDVSKSMVPVGSNGLSCAQSYQEVEMAELDEMSIEQLATNLLHAPGSAEWQKAQTEVAIRNLKAQIEATETQKLVIEVQRDAMVLQKHAIAVQSASAVAERKAAEASIASSEAAQKAAKAAERNARYMLGSVIVSSILTFVALISAIVAAVSIYYSYLSAVFPK